MLVASPRKESPSDHALRTQVVIDRLGMLVQRLNSTEFEVVRPARWRHKATGHAVETGYSYGEGRVRVFLDGGRSVDADYVISGRDDDLVEFHKLFPVSSS